MTGFALIAEWSFGFPVNLSRWVLNGPAHVAKNVVGALRSAARTVHFGKFWCDAASTLDTGMPPGAFQGHDGQSDREAALYMNGALAFITFIEFPGLKTHGKGFVGFWMAKSTLRFKGF